MIHINSSMRRWSRLAAVATMLFLTAMLAGVMAVSTHSDRHDGSRFTLHGHDGTPRTEVYVDQSDDVVVLIRAVDGATRWGLRILDDRPVIAILDESAAESDQLDLLELASIASDIESARRSLAHVYGVQRELDHRVKTIEDQAAALRKVPRLVEQVRAIPAGIQKVGREVSNLQHNLRRLREGFTRQKRDFEHLEREVRDLRDRPR